MPSSRMHRGLVALSASAIAAVYMAGYLRTQSADASIGAVAAAPIATTAPLDTTSTAIPQVTPVVQGQMPTAPLATPSGR